jgi:hypothetical protein
VTLDINWLIRMTVTPTATRKSPTLNAPVLP